MGRTAWLGAATLLTPTLGPAFGAEPAASQASWELGCYTRAFDQFDYRVALDSIAEAGFKHVGLMTTNTRQWVMIKTTTPPEEVQAMSAEAKKRGLKVLSIYGDFSLGESLDAGIKGLKRLIDDAVICECPNLLLGGTTDPKLYQPYYKAIAESCDYAAAKGVGLSIKPHGGQNATGPQCRKAIELVNHPSFRLWYDPGNILYYSDGKLDPAQDAATVDGLVGGMIVKDFRPPKEVLVNPGTGKVDFPAVLARLKQGGFTRGALIVECLDRGDLEKVKAAAKRTLELLERWTGQRA